MKNTKAKTQKVRPLTRPLTFAEECNDFLKMFPSDESGNSQTAQDFIEVMKLVELSRPFSLDEIVNLSKFKDMSLPRLCAMFQTFTGRLVKNGTLTRISNLVYDHESFILTQNV